LFGGEDIVRIQIHVGAAAILFSLIIGCANRDSAPGTDSRAATDQSKDQRPDKKGGLSSTSDAKNESKGPWDPVLRKYAYPKAKRVAGQSVPDESTATYVTADDPKTVLTWYGEKLQVITGAAHLTAEDYNVRSASFGSNEGSYLVEGTVSGAAKERQTRITLTVKAAPKAEQKK
jgi:hypothetical protein